MRVRARDDEFLSGAADSAPHNEDSASLTIRDENQAARHRQAWQRLMDYQLIEWGLNPTQIEDEGVEPPSLETIGRAYQLAKSYQARGYPPPDSVVPDGNGGIAFERREREVVEVLYVWGDGETEYQQFQGTRLIERRPL